MDELKAKAVEVTKDDYPNPILEVKNYGRFTRISFCGVDISCGVRTAKYIGFSPISGKANRILLDVEIERIMETLANISDEELITIREQLQRYKKKKSKINSTTSL